MRIPGDRRVVAGATALGGAAVAVAGRQLGRLLGDDASNGRVASDSRTYRLKRSEPVESGIRRIALGRLDSTLAELRGEGETDEVAAVHEARKDLKKLRSLLRLVRESLGDGLYSRENEALRDAGRLLAGMRDADVMVAALDEVIEGDADRAADGAAPALRKILKEQRRSARAAGGESAREQASARIEAVAERVSEWPLDGVENAILAGVQRSYRRGRNRFHDARSATSVESLHEWRKRVKDLWYHVRILRNAWRESFEPLADQLHDLSDHLGDDHDLALLAEQVGDLDVSADDRLALLELIDRRREELQAAAFSLGERLYADKPKAFRQRIEASWSAWRDRDLP